MYKLKNLLAAPEYAGLSDSAAAVLANQQRHEADDLTQWTNPTKVGR